MLFVEIISIHSNLSTNQVLSCTLFALEYWRTLFEKRLYTLEVVLGARHGLLQFSLEIE